MSSKKKIRVRKPVAPPPPDDLSSLEGARGLFDRLEETEIEVKEEPKNTSNTFETTPISTSWTDIGLGDGPFAFTPPSPSSSPWHPDMPAQKKQPQEALQPPVQPKPQDRTIASPPLPVQDEWRRAKAICQWAKQNAPALIVGGLTGAGVRVAAQFALAAFVTTTPGVVAAIGSAMAIGAVAGGVSKLVTTSIWGGTKKEDKHWKRKAFLQGAAMGVIGAGIGAGVAQWLISNDYLGGWFSHSSAPSEAPAQAAAPLPEPEIAPPPVAPMVETPAPANVSDVPAAPSVAEATTPAAAPSAVEAPAPAALVETSPAVIPQGNVEDLLTKEQFAKLPVAVQKLASSSDPHEIARFCKEASFKLINGADRSPESLQVGAKLIERGLEVAKDAGLNNTVTKMLHADLAYLKAWGIGTDKNIDLALDHARQSGTAVHNYGQRLLRLFSQPANG
ncbi:MAG: hypothetical protein FWF24_03045 [Alphaproteobacteria bacterium]|nr:hypothetical protein [Alphaproteobacteria bacterium]